MKSLDPRLGLATKLLYDFILTTVVLKSASSSAGLRMTIRVRELNPPFGHNPPVIAFQALCLPSAKGLFILGLQSHSPPKTAYPTSPLSNCW